MIPVSKLCSIGRMFDPQHPTCRTCKVGCGLKAAFKPSDMPAARPLAKRSEYMITPMGKPRMTQRDKWEKRPATTKYHEFCDEVRDCEVNLPLSGAHVTFVLPMPQSWPEKKKLNLVGKAHQLKPDVDNCLKALMDAIFDDDSKVWDIRTTKLWGREGQIVIE